MSGPLPVPERHAAFACGMIKLRTKPIRIAIATTATMNTPDTIQPTSFDFMG